MSWAKFIEIVNQKSGLDILELGTKRSNKDIKTEHSRLFNNYKSYIKSDFESGIDVDVVCDAHKLSKCFYDLDVVIVKH